MQQSVTVVALDSRADSYVDTLEQANRFQTCEIKITDCYQVLERGWEEGGRGDPAAKRRSQGLLNGTIDVVLKMNRTVFNK